MNRGWADGMSFEDRVGLFVGRGLPPAPRWRTNLVIQEELVVQLSQLDPERGEALTYPALVWMRARFGNPVFTQALRRFVSRLRERVDTMSILSAADLPSLRVEEI